jgi:hypothetical protein
MTEFQTTKIGDRWFLVFEECLLPVDAVELIRHADWCEDKSKRCVLFYDTQQDLTPVKLPSSQPQFTQAEAIIKWAHEHASRIE